MPDWKVGDLFIFENDSFKNSGGIEIDGKWYEPQLHHRAPMVYIVEKISTRGEQRLLSRGMWKRADLAVKVMEKQNA